MLKDFKQNWQMSSRSRSLNFHLLLQSWIPAPVKSFADLQSAVVTPQYALHLAF